MFNLSSEIIFGQFLDIWRLFTGHTDRRRRCRHRRLRFCLCDFETNASVKSFRRRRQDVGAVTFFNFQIEAESLRTTNCLVN